MGESNRLKILLAYDGANFRGIALNPDVPTVAGTLKMALEQVLNRPVLLRYAGRTDAGVHAFGQVVSVEFNSEVGAKLKVDLPKLKVALQSLCRDEVSIREVSWADSNFDARWDAKSRLYHYFISNQPDMNPFVRHISWHIRDSLDLKAMKKATRYFLGENDFSSFCRKPDNEDKSLIRFVMNAGWEVQDNNLLRFHIRANSFCQQMVRSIVGTLVDVGRGNKSPKDMEAIFAAKNRSMVVKLAPPQGLILQKVFY